MSFPDPSHILLVEDDEDHADIIQFALTEVFPGTTVTWIDHGTSALEHLERCVADRALPDLVILDLKLPGHSGVELLRRLRTREGADTLPVVVLTTSSAPEDRLAAEEAGASAFVVKVFRLADLTSLLRVAADTARQAVTGGAA